MNTLHQNDTQIQFGNFSIHHKASIEWLKYFNNTITLQYHTKLHVYNHLGNVRFEHDKAIILITTDNSHSRYSLSTKISNINIPTMRTITINERKSRSHTLLITIYIYLPLFTLSVITPTMPTIEKHYYVVLLAPLLKSFKILYPIRPIKTHSTYQNKILQQNQVLHKLQTVPVFNIMPKLCAPINIESHPTPCLLSQQSPPPPHLYSIFPSI